MITLVYLHLIQLFNSFFFSLRIPLVNESTEIRAATLRTIRHLTTTSEAARAISILNIHYLISRCLDIELDNKIERLQALKLCRILTFLNQGQCFPMILLRSLVAIAEEGKKKDDRLEFLSESYLALHF